MDFLFTLGDHDTKLTVRFSMVWEELNERWVKSTQTSEREGARKKADCRRYC